MVFRQNYAVTLVVSEKKKKPHLALDQKAPGVAVDKVARSGEMVSFTLKVPRKSAPGEILGWTCRGYEAAEEGGYLGSHARALALRAGKGPLALQMEFPAAWMPKGSEARHLEVFVIYGTEKRPK